MRMSVNARLRNFWRRIFLENPALFLFRRVFLHLHLLWTWSQHLPLINRILSQHQYHHNFSDIHRINVELFSIAIDFLQGDFECMCPLIKVLCQIKTSLFSNFSFLITYKMVTFLLTSKERNMWHRILEVTAPWRPTYDCSSHFWSALGVVRFLFQKLNV